MEWNVWRARQQTYELSNREIVGKVNKSKSKILLKRLIKSVQCLIKWKRQGRKISDGYKRGQLKYSWKCKIVRANKQLYANTFENLKWTFLEKIYDKTEEMKN